MALLPLIEEPIDGEMEARLYEVCRERVRKHE
jgi:hypothetical protein